jgi:hypothetical protein
MFTCVNYWIMFWTFLQHFWSIIMCFTSIYFADIHDGFSIWSSRSSGYQEFSRLGYNTLYSIESQPMILRNMLPLSLWWKSNPSTKLAWNRQQAKLGSFFNPEDGGNIFFQNISCLSMDYTALYLRRLNSLWCTVYASGELLYFYLCLVLC